MSIRPSAAEAQQQQSQDKQAAHTLRNLVFDFGGVLFRWQPADLLARHFPEHAGTPTQAQQLAHNLFHHADWHAFDGGHATLEHTAQRCAQRLGLPSTGIMALVSSIADHLEPLDDTVALLQRLHRRRQAAQPHEPAALKLYFLSNMPEPYARVLEQRHGFLGCFDGGVFSGDVKLIKPDAAIYAHLQNRYGLQAAQTLFIDDYAANVAAAQAHGWHSVRFSSAAQLEADLRNYGIQG